MDAAGDAMTCVPFSDHAGRVGAPVLEQLRPCTAPTPSRTASAAGQITILLLQEHCAGPAETPVGITREDFLVGRRAMLLSDPADASRPRRA